MPIFSSSAGNDGILSEATWLLNSDLLPNSNSATRAIGYRQVYPNILFLSIYLNIVRRGFLLSAVYSGLPISRGYKIKP